jgi:adenosylhomocysteine nucleosidase
MAAARPVGIVCALAEELTALEAAIAGKRATRHAGIRFIAGQIDGAAVVLAEGGVGKVGAAVVATLLVERFRCRALVNSGVAGGLDPKSGIGDILIADRLAQHDFGAVTDRGWIYFRAGHPPWPGPRQDLYYRMAPELRARLKRALAGLRLPPLSAAVTGKQRRPKLKFGTVVTGDQFVSNAAMGRRLRQDFGARATEMEGAAVAQVAERFGLPCVVVRALSDRADRHAIRNIRAFLEETGRAAAMVVVRILRAI